MYDRLSMMLWMIIQISLSLARRESQRVAEDLESNLGIILGGSGQREALGALQGFMAQSKIGTRRKISKTNR